MPATDATGLPVLRPAPVPVEEVLDMLAARHRAADGGGMRLVALIGGSADNLVERLPPGVRDRLEGATRLALETAFDVARASRGVVADRSDWLNSALSAALGAAGGAGGLPTALAELPVTATVLLRAIQGIAADHGFEPGDEAVRIECLRVFANAGPLRKDDGADLGFLAARLALTSPTVRQAIGAVVPRLAAVFGQKIAAQAAPVVGALSGAAVNWVFTAYYQDMARIHFGLMRLSLDSGVPRAVLEEGLRARLLPRLA
ncbi:MAG: EcsC family protein [Rhodobacteraceae bacterium]|nr:EcsC family protein [Paracoccaceae bacterium]